MSLFDKIKIRMLGAPLAAGRALTVAKSNVDFLLSEARDIQVAKRAVDTLEEQMHAVVNRNADGVNLSALSIRRETDLLLSLGISDPVAAKAGTLAQLALELANAGRGVNLQNEMPNVSPQERVRMVAKAIAVVTRAETLLVDAKKHNRKRIDHALRTQSKIITQMSSHSYTASLIA